MEFLKTYAKEIVSVLVPFVTWFLNVGLKARPKLIWTNPHSFRFLVQQPLLDQEGKIIKPVQEVDTASIKVVNTGRETATKIELVFNWKPHYLNLWPVRHYEQVTEADGRHILIFENLSPKEEIGIEIISINADLPALIFVRSAECIANNMPLMWIPYVQQWKITIARFFIFMGISSTIYLTIMLIQFLVLKTPN
ncbi:MAG TPA: hypothetical protein VIZ65_00060 [Cellvibrionaceae bacterium]